MILSGASWVKSWWRGVSSCIGLLTLGAAAVLSPHLFAQSSGIPQVNPKYSIESIANAAAGVTDLFAPNTFISIYGQDLSFVTRAMSQADIRGGELPTVLIGTGVRTFVSSVSTNVYYVSPNQVNILLPPLLTPGRVRLQLVNEGRAGPRIEILLRETAPSIFQQAESGTANPLVVATHLSGAVVTPADPARTGEIVVIYTTGLGPTIPPAIPYRIPEEAACLRDYNQFAVWLDGVPVNREDILYAGVTPFFAGLYQINLRLPEWATANPEIRVGTPQLMSPEGRMLALDPEIHVTGFADVRPVCH